MSAKKAVAKKAAGRKAKDRWAYEVEGEMSYETFPSYAAAYKDVVEDLMDNRQYSDARVKVRFYQLARESNFEFEVKEIPVMTREVVFKGEVK